MTPSVEVVPIGGGNPLREASLARELASRFLVWDAFVAGRRRVDVHPLLLPAEMHAAAVRAAEGVVAAVGRVAARAHDDATERARYGFDDDVVRLAAASRASGDDASLMRVDLLLDKSGAWKACESTPTAPEATTSRSVYRASPEPPASSRAAIHAPRRGPRGAAARAAQAAAPSASCTPPGTPRTSRCAPSSPASCTAPASAQSSLPRPRPGCAAAISASTASRCGPCTATSPPNR